MEDEKLVEELEQEQKNNYEAIPVRSENLLWKTAKLGAFFALTGLGLKKAKLTKDLPKDLIAFGAVATGTLLNTDDNESYSDDFASLGILLASYSGFKSAKSLIKNDDYLEQTSKWLNKADDIVKGIRVFIPEVVEQSTKFVSNTLQENLIKNSQNLEKKEGLGEVLSKITVTAKSGAETLFTSFATGINKLINERTEIYKNVIENSGYAKYLKRVEEDKNLPFILTEMNKDLDESIGIEMENLEVEKWYNKIPIIGKNLNFYNGPDEIKGKIQDLKNAKKEVVKQLKYQKINEQSFFKDLLGEFTEVIDGQKEVRYGKILNDNANYISSYNTWISAYKKEISNASEQNEEGFINWLKNRNITADESEKEQISNFIDSLHNQKSSIKISDLKKYVGRTFDYKVEKGLDSLDIKFNDELKDDEILKFLKNSNNGKNEIFDIAIEDVFDNNSVKVGETFKITGIKNENLIGNFALTDVVYKTKDNKILDKTTGDGFLLFNKTLGLLENLSPAHYMPNDLLTKQAIKRWDVFSLIDSKNRRKEYIVNEMQKLSSIGEKNGEIGSLFLDHTKFTSVTVTDFKESKNIDNYIKRNVAKRARSSFEEYKDSKLYDDELYDDLISKSKGDVKLRNQIKDWHTLASYENLVRKNKINDRNNILDIDNIDKQIEIIQKNGDLLQKANSEFLVEKTFFVAPTFKDKNMKQYFSKKIMDVVSEETNHAKKYAKNADYKLMEGKDFEDKLSKFTYSEWNFLPFRYKNGKFHTVSAREDYFKESETLFHSFLSKIGKSPEEILDREVKIEDVVKFNNNIKNKVYNQLEGLLEATIGEDEIHYIYSNTLKSHADTITTESLRKDFFQKLVANFVDKNDVDINEAIKVLKNNETITAEETLKLMVDLSKKTKDKDLAALTMRAQSSFAFKKIVEETKEGDIFDFSFENTKKVLEDKELYDEDIFKIFGGSEREILNEGKKIRGAIKANLAEEFLNRSEGTQFNAYFSFLHAQVNKALKNGEIDQDGATEFKNQLDKAKILFKDFSDAFTEATRDSYNTSDNHILKGFIVNASEKLSREMGVEANYENQQINLANRLHQFAKKHKNLLEDQVEYDENGISTNVTQTVYRDLNLKFFDDLDDALDAKDTHGSLKQKMKAFNDKYFNISNQDVSSVVLKNGLDFDNGLKGLFDSLKEFFIGKSKAKKLEEKIKIAAIEEILKLKTNSIDDFSLNKNQILSDNFSNVQMKGIFSSLEDAFEQVGVSRLINNKISDAHWTRRGGDVLLKRFGTMALGITTLLAGNSLVDAILPDEIPIIGKGPIATLAMGVASARLGMQYAFNYTGISATFRGLDYLTGGILNQIPVIGNIGMDAEEMKDEYFHGKAIRVNKNRFWHSAGRQSIAGEEFDQYRPHVLYTLMNPTTGVRAMDNGYFGKWQKFFRKDFLPTKYPWYLIDPYREERIAYKKYGAVYPVTERLFKDIPVVGDLLSATLGELIKPTQYIDKESWLVDGQYIKNPNYREGSDTPKYMKITKTEGLHGILPGIFGGIEDLKTFAGLKGYATTKTFEFLFGKSHPYEKTITLASISDDISYASEYNKYSPGGLLNATEPIRRFLDEHNSLGTTIMNPTRQNLPYWMPEYFKKGRNPAMTYNFGSYITNTEDFNNTVNHIDSNDNLNRFRILSMIAPKSKEFEEMKNRVLNKISNMTEKEKSHYYESLGYAEKYGSREYTDPYEHVGKTKTISVKIKEKLTPYEFIGTDNKRYKLDTVTSDFNKLSERYGKTNATKLMSNLDKTFNVGSTYQFTIATSANYAGGIDDDGDFFRVDSKLVNSKLDLDNSPYRNSSFSVGNVLSNFTNKIIKIPLNMTTEKWLGRKSVIEEWGAETVQSNYFRDWDKPITSFIEPYYTFTSNSVYSGAILGAEVNSLSEKNVNDIGLLGGLVNLGRLNYAKNLLTGGVTRSSDYRRETEIHDKIEEIKLINGERNIYNLTGKEYLAQVGKMVNEQDSKFLKDLLNVRGEKDRKEILKLGNERLGTVLKMIWNRQQQALDGTSPYQNWQMEKPKDVYTLGVRYSSNQEQLKNRIKSYSGYEFSKLDSKRQGIYNAYVSSEEERYIEKKLNQQYGQRPRTVSTIYPQGQIQLVNQF